APAAEGGAKRPLPAPPKRRDSGASAPASTTVGEGPAPAALEAGGEFDEEADWRRVFDEFVALKQKLGEPAEKLTYEKFRGTLQRNKDALIERHAGCKRVEFRVYEKQGKAALKASPVK
ncbi:MAG: hypothetical protein HY908_27700, partial [Myxococcales bacterium]|nr:hypothetical protein [Myxococcales bacterium]